MADPETLTRWRREFQNLHDTLMRGREQFDAWFEETAMLEAEIKTETDELRESIADIKKDQRHYQQVIAQVPKPVESSAEELEKRIGKASQLLDLAGEISSMEIHLPARLTNCASCYGMFCCEAAPALVASSNNLSKSLGLRTE